MSGRRLIWSALGLSWLIAVGAGTGLLWSYSLTAGVSAAAPEEWPAGSRIERGANRATLLMFAHPQCPCTRASIGELASVIARCQGRVEAYVVFLKPAGFGDEWVESDLWGSAASIPGVRVIADTDGIEARRFSAATSGQTVLYDEDGRLLFSGGITGARGHAGDNPGRSTVVSLLTAGGAEQARSPVFGCSLVDSPSQCNSEQVPVCPN